MCVLFICLQCHTKDPNAGSTWKGETTCRDTMQDSVILLTWDLEVEHKLDCQQENNWQGQKC